MAAPAFPGRIIHAAHDGDLELQVVDTATSRSLHFGTLSRQSSMWLHSPNKLQLPYTRAMMSFLLFCPQPRSVLLIGLGGGSQAKFLLHNFPDCRIDAAEPSAAVVAIANKYFQLPTSERLHVHLATGQEYLDTLPASARYDAILVDAFLAHGSAACVKEQRFMAGCASRLRVPGGVLAANLWRGRNTGYGESLEALRQAFGALPLRLPIGGRGNIVAVCPGEPYGRQDCADLRGRAQDLKRRLGLDFPAYLQTLGDSCSLWQRLLARM